MSMAFLTSCWMDSLLSQAHSMKQALRQVMDAQKADEPQGMTCGPDGCRIADHKA